MVFAPKGDVARWRMIYNEIKDRPAGTIVTFDEMIKILGMENTPTEISKAVIQSSMKRINREFIRELGSEAAPSMVSVRTQGYRMTVIKQPEVSDLEDRVKVLEEKLQNLASAVA